MTTTAAQTESIEGVVPVPIGPDSSVTYAPAFPDAQDVIARVFAAFLEREAIKAGSREFAVELVEWSEATVAVQADTLPEH
jgi:hypothetical protein